MIGTIEGAAASVVLVNVVVGLSIVTIHVTARFCTRHRPVRGRFSTRVVESTHATARLPGVSRASFVEPGRHLLPSASIIARLVVFTHNAGA